MTTAFPGGIDTFVNPTATDALNSATVPHAAQHDNLNDAVKAIQTALGINLTNVGNVFKGIANTFTVAPQQITVDNATHTALVLQGIVSQSADLVQVKTNSYTPSLFDYQGLLSITDTATAHDGALRIQHYGTGASGDTVGQTWGIDIHNYPSATAAFVIHQYSHADTLGAFHIDNTDTSPAFVIHNTQNSILNPGRDGTGDYLQLQDHGTTILALSKALSIDLYTGPQGALPLSVVGHGGLGMFIGTPAGTTGHTLQVDHEGTSTGQAIEVINQGTGNSLHIIHNGASRAVKIDIGAGAVGQQPVLVGGYDYGPVFTTSNDGGDSFTVTKNGTVSGRAMVVTNKGTGLTADFRSASASVATISNTGLITSIGNDTSSGTAFSSPAVTSAVAFTPSSTTNAQVTFQLAGITGSYTITYGPSTGAENTLCSAVPTLLNVGDVVSFMVPKGWKVVLTLTTVTLTSTKVTTF